MCPRLADLEPGSKGPKGPYEWEKARDRGETIDEVFIAEAVKEITNDVHLWFKENTPLSKENIEDREKVVKLRVDKARMELGALKAEADEKRRAELTEKVNDMQAKFDKILGKLNKGEYGTPGKYDAQIQHLIRSINLSNNEVGHLLTFKPPPSKMHIDANIRSARERVGNSFVKMRDAIMKGKAKTEDFNINDLHRDLAELGPSVTSIIGSPPPPRPTAPLLRSQLEKNKKMLDALNYFKKDIRGIYIGGALTPKKHLDVILSKKRNEQLSDLESSISKARELLSKPTEGSFKKQKKQVSEAQKNYNEARKIIDEAIKKVENDLKNEENYPTKDKPSTQVLSRMYWFTRKLRTKLGLEKEKPTIAKEATPPPVVDVTSTLSSNKAEEPPPSDIEIPRDVSPKQKTPVTRITKTPGGAIPRKIETQALPETKFEAQPEKGLQGKWVGATKPTGKRGDAKLGERREATPPPDDLPVIEEDKPVAKSVQKRIFTKTTIEEKLDNIGLDLLRISPEDSDDPQYKALSDAITNAQIDLLNNKNVNQVTETLGKKITEIEEILMRAGDYKDESSLVGRLKNVRKEFESVGITFDKPSLPPPPAKMPPTPDLIIKRDAMLNTLENFKDIRGLYQATEKKGLLTFNFRHNPEKDIQIKNLEAAIMAATNVLKQPDGNKDHRMLQSNINSAIQTLTLSINNIEKSLKKEGALEQRTSKMVKVIDKFCNGLKEKGVFIERQPESRQEEAKARKHPKQ